MSQLRVTSTALLCPSGGQRSLCPLSVSLQFLGHVSEAQRECAIPIQITVTMPSSLSQSLFPLISISSLPSTLADGVQHVAGRDRDILRRAIATMPITFLPISSDFDFRNSRSWATLADRVADWLIAVVADTRSPVWTWGREAFWITFVGAHPRFPDGEWPNWPCEIMLDGTFITYWMRRQQSTSSYSSDSSEEGDGGGHTVPVAEAEQDIPVYHHLHAELWARLQQHISVLHSI